MRSIRFPAVLSFLFACFVSSAFSEEALESVPPVNEIDAEDVIDIDTGATKNERRPEVGLQLWMTSGHGEWEIEFGALFLGGRSKLEWEDIDAPILVLHGEVPLTKKLSFGLLVGQGDIDDGTNTDGDWLDDFQVSESKAETSGDVSLADVNVYYTMIEDELSKRPFTLDVFLGLQYYKDDLNDRNGVQTIENERRVNKPFRGLNSKYRFEWKMVRVGTRVELALDDHVSLGGSLAFLYVVDYKGEAFWNLRDDYRNVDPNFIHEANGGAGLEGKASIKVRIAEDVYVDGGYWFMFMNAQDGKDTVYFSDGTQDSTPLKEVTTFRQGLYGGIAFEFL